MVDSIDPVSGNGNDIELTTFNISTTARNATTEANSVLRGTNSRNGQAADADTVVNDAPTEDASIGAPISARPPPIFRAPIETLNQIFEYVDYNGCVNARAAHPAFELVTDRNLYKKRLEYYKMLIERPRPQSRLRTKCYHCTTAGMPSHLCPWPSALHTRLFFPCWECLRPVSTMAIQNRNWRRMSAVYENTLYLLCNNCHPPEEFIDREDIVRKMQCFVCYHCQNRVYAFKVWWGPDRLPICGTCAAAYSSKVLLEMTVACLTAACVGLSIRLGVQPGCVASTVALWLFTGFVRRLLFSMVSIANMLSNLF